MNQLTKTLLLSSVFSDLAARIHDRLTRRKMERVFRRKQDPYRYATSAYEQARISRIVSESRQFSGAALELGCSEGYITSAIAPKFSRLVALDISETALKRGRERVGDMPSVEFVLANAREWVAAQPPAQFDLIIASEVLYYLGEGLQKGALWESTFREFLRQLIAVVRPGGSLLLAHGFGTAFERKVRASYGDRLVELGLVRRLSVETGAGTDKGTMCCLIERFDRP